MQERVSYVFITIVFIDGLIFTSFPVDKISSIFVAFIVSFVFDTFFVNHFSSYQYTIFGNDKNIRRNSFCSHIDHQHSDAVIKSLLPTICINNWTWFFSFNSINFSIKSFFFSMNKLYHLRCIIIVIVK